MKKLIYITLLFYSALLTSCTEVITVDLDDQKPQLVIEAKVVDSIGSNNAPYAYVKISESANYFDAKKKEPINNAQVILTDNHGNITEMLFDGKVYLPEQPLKKPMSGTVYTIEVIHNNKTYKASNQYTTYGGIDSMTYKFKPKEFLFDEGYYATIYANENGGEENYYRFIFRRTNNTIDSTYDIIAVTDDALVNGGYINFEVNIPGKKGDRIYATMSSVSKQEYEYLLNLNKQVNNPGGPFGNQPENLPGNFNNGALGFFGVSSASTKYVDIR